MLQGLANSLIQRSNARYDRQLLIEGIVLAAELPSVMRYSLAESCLSCGETCECGEDIRDVGVQNFEQKLKAVDIPDDVPTEEKVTALYQDVKNVVPNTNVDPNMRTMTEGDVRERLKHHLAECIELYEANPESAVALRRVNAVKAAMEKLNM